MFILRKTRELVFVLLRVAVYIRRPSLREKIDRWSLELLEYVALEDYEQSLKIIRVLESLINFSHLIYEIEPINASILIKELSTVDSAIRQHAGLEKLPDLDSLFSKTSIDNQAVSQESKENGGENGAGAVIRQSAILEIIRQNPEKGYQLKDLIAEFPDVSERTLRYDLQKLVMHGFLNRMGSSGPATTYYCK